MPTTEFKVPSRSIADLIDGVLTDDEDSDGLFDIHEEYSSDSKDTPTDAQDLDATAKTDESWGIKDSPIAAHDLNATAKMDESWGMDAELDEVMNKEKDDADAVAAAPPQNELMMCVPHRSSIN